MNPHKPTERPRRLLPSRRDVLRLGLLATGSVIVGCGDAEGSVLGDTDPVGLPGDRVIVIGAGISGLAAASELRRNGFAVTVIEARERIGGRVYTDRSLGVPVDLGASWIQGSDGNPLTDLASGAGIATAATDWDRVALYDADGRRFTNDELAEIEATFEELISDVEGVSESAGSDISLGEAIRRAIAGETLDAEEQRLLDWAIAQLELDIATDVDRISTWEGDDTELGGTDVLFPGGYDQIANLLASDLDLKLGEPVTRIDWGSVPLRVTTERAVHEAERVVVTVPLGVLKAGRLTFDPPLPAPKQTAIDRLGFGLLQKVALRFPSVFWPEDVDFVGYVSNTPGEFPVSLNWAKHTGSPILIAFYSAEFAEGLAGQNAEQRADRALSVLRSIFGSTVPEPEAIAVSVWDADPFALGSYSFIALGATASDHDALAEPLGERVFFAGEATARTHTATVHGAYLSGMREARRIGG